MRRHDVFHVNPYLAVLGVHFVRFALRVGDDFVSKRSRFVAKGNCIIDVSLQVTHVVLNVRYVVPYLPFVTRTVAKTVWNAGLFVCAGSIGFAAVETWLRACRCVVGACACKNKRNKCDGAFWAHLSSRDCLCRIDRHVSRESIFEQNGHHAFRADPFY